MTREKQAQLLSTLLYRMTSQEAEQATKLIKASEYAGYHLGTSAQVSARRDLDAFCLNLINARQEQDVKNLTTCIDSILANQSHG